MPGDALRDLLIYAMSLLFAVWAFWVTVGAGGWSFVASARMRVRVGSFPVLSSLDVIVAWVAIVTRPS